MKHESSSHMQPLLGRRQFLINSGMGLGGIALSQLLGAKAAKPPFRPDIVPARPYAARHTHNRPKAQQVLVIFCSGACSQIDTFDYKPELIRRHGQPLPGADSLVTFQGKQGSLNQSPWKFRQYGQSGKYISDLVPQIGQMADELCFIHSLTGKTNTHGPGENYMCTGNTLEGFPSVGAWTSYALGSENDNLPAYVAIPDPRGTPQSSVNCWGAGFLPAAFQGTAFNAAKPINNLARPKNISPSTDEATRGFLQRMNKRHLQRYPGESELAARIASHELAARMQLSVPEVSDIYSEPSHVLRAYGADDTQNQLKATFARNCILARRLVEQGVRFVQLFNGAYQTGGEGVSNWDGHKVLKEQYSKHGPVLDQPVAALLADMKQRGLLEQTLVVWCTEFGRMPTFQVGASGRDHNPDGFTAWMAGAGVRRGHTHGATDDFSYKAVQDVASVHDFHATILHLLGLEHERLTFYHNGLERRLTDVEGNIIQEVLA